MKLDEGDFDPCEEVRAGLRLLGAEAEGKQIELTTLLHEPAPIMRGDAQMFCQICFKLAGNGVKFSPIGSQVIVVCSVEDRSEEHTSELQSLMRISYAVFCLKKKKTTHNDQ